MESEKRIFGRRLAKGIAAAGLILGTPAVIQGLTGIAFPVQPDNCISVVNNGETITADELTQRMESGYCTLHLSDLNNRGYQKELGLGAILIGAGVGGLATVISTSKPK